MIFDPLYIAVLVIGMGLSGVASMWTRAAFNKWSQVPTERGMTGAQVAASILRAEGIEGVGIEPAHGFLSDHYDPRSKTLRLSPEVFEGRTVAAAGIAAHEVGHAIQDAHGFLPMRLRQLMVPVANLGTNLGLWLVIGGMILGFTGLSTLGVALFGGFVLFTVVTLPVELDASRRARNVLVENRLLSPAELSGVSRILTAAATTYLAAAVTAVLQLVYWMFRLGLLGGRED